MNDKCRQWIIVGCIQNVIWSPAQWQQGLLAWEAAVAASVAVCRTAGRMCPVTSGCSWRPRLWLWCAAEGGLGRGQDQCSHGSQTGRYSGGVIIDMVTNDTVMIETVKIDIAMIDIVTIDSSGEWGKGDRELAAQ